MTPKTHPPGMDRRIFEMGLPVEAVSLYLLCCNVVRGQAPLTLKTMVNLWNSSDKALENGLAILVGHNILKPQTDAGQDPHYLLQEAAHWKTP